VVFAIIEILHLVNPHRYGPAGGRGALQGAMIGLVSAGAIAAILTGAVAGTQDVSADMFRDLVATGRSRWQLFAARVPGALAVFLPMITIGYVVIAICSVTLAGSLQTPGASLIVRGYLWVVLYTGFDLMLAVGFASLVGSRAVTNGVLIGWQFIAAPLLAHVTILGGARQALYTGALDRLNPLPVVGGPPEVVHSVPVAAGVLVAWTAVALAAGGWRTATRDA
jgi:ABC-type transport system involved in multi-copper enzyme maturation permease subunit